MNGTSKKNLQSSFSQKSSSKSWDNDRNWDDAEDEDEQSPRDDEPLPLSKRSSHNRKNSPKSWDDDLNDNVDGFGDADEAPTREMSGYDESLPLSANSQDDFGDQNQQNFESTRRDFDSPSSPEEKRDMIYSVMDESALPTETVLPSEMDSSTLLQNPLLMEPIISTRI